LSFVQVAHGDQGVEYVYSGITVAAKPWTPLLLKLRDKAIEVNWVSIQLCVDQQVHTLGGNNIFFIYIIEMLLKKQ